MFEQRRLLPHMVAGARKSACLVERLMRHFARQSGLPSSNREDRQGVLGHVLVYWCISAFKGPFIKEYLVQGTFCTEVKSVS